MEGTDGLWLFGYGSLIWKPPPHFDQRIPGYIKGFVRRFWQASEDHRGYPDRPGRVVTLIEYSFWSDLLLGNKNIGPDLRNEQVLAENPETAHSDIVYGVAYHIPTDHVAEVQAYLDIREINGYSIHYVPFYVLQDPPSSSLLISPSTSSVETGPEPRQNPHIDRCMIYIGLPTNPQFVGPESIENTARVIARSEGPSGPNPEYLFMLEKGLQQLADKGQLALDGYVKALSEEVRKIMNVAQSGRGLEAEVQA